jgi:hypothetical protein
MTPKGSFFGLKTISIEFLVKNWPKVSNDIGLNVQESPVQMNLAENLHTYVF